MDADLPLIAPIAARDAPITSNAQDRQAVRAAAAAVLTLATAPMGQPFTVQAVVSANQAPEWPAQLADIGFLPGERVAVMARGLPGNDPLVVRVGLSTFALRTAEAACVQIAPLTVDGPAVPDAPAAVREVAGAA